MRELVLLPLVFGCASASLRYQSAATFTDTYGCDAAHVVATQAPRSASSTYDVFVVRGCGYRQIYACATDIGCIPPEQVPAESGAAFKLPPTLIDTVPPPPPQVAPDAQSGS